MVIEERSFEVLELVPWRLLVVFPMHLELVLEVELAPCLWNSEELVWVVELVAYPMDLKLVLVLELVVCPKHLGQMDFV